MRDAATRNKAMRADKNIIISMKAVSCQQHNDAPHLRARAPLALATAAAVCTYKAYKALALHLIVGRRRRRRH